MNESKSTTSSYENNPLSVAIQGIDLLFKKAKSVGILLAVFVVLGLLGNIPQSFNQQAPAQTQQTPTTNTSLDTTNSNLDDVAVENAFSSVKDSLGSVGIEIWLIGALFVLVILAVFLFIAFLISGIMDYTSSQLAANKEVALTEAAKHVLSNLWGYAWVQVIVGVKTFLWTLLFVLPGIYMAVRYSLSGVSYFKGHKGNAAVKQSLALTRGAWLTTFASESLIYMLTLGIPSPLFDPGTKAVLYRQYAALEKSNTAKPAAHALSWLALIIPIILLLLLALFIGVVIKALSTTT